MVFTSPSSLLTTPSSSCWKKRMQLLFLIEWSIISIGLAFLVSNSLLQWSGYDELFAGLLYCWVSTFFIITHFLLWKFPLKTKSITIFSILSFIFWIWNILLLLWVKMPGDPWLLFGVVGFIFNFPMIVLMLPFWKNSLIQVLKYKKELEIQSILQTNKTK